MLNGMYSCAFFMDAKDAAFTLVIAPCAGESARIPIILRTTGLKSLQMSLATNPGSAATHIILFFGYLASNRRCISTVIARHASLLDP